MMKCINQFLIGVGSFFLMGMAVYAGTPLWSFTPLTATTVSVPAGTTATIQYTVTNQSSLTHTLVMRPITGVTQITTLGNCPSPFTLAFHQSCTLTLQITGSELSGNISSGPVVCQQGSSLQCYQPSVANSLNISRLGLYGVTGDGSASQPETLFTLDSATGNATFLMALGNGGDGESIASDGNNLFHLSGNNNPTVFEKINLNNLTTTNITLTGDLPLNEIYGSVFFKQSGSLLLTDLNNNLFNLTLNGNVTLKAAISPSANIRGLACFNHRIFGINSSDPFLYEINPNTGVIITSHPVTLAGFTVNGGNGLTVNPSTGVFYALLNVQGSIPRKLVTIDVTTGVASLIGNADNGSGLARFATIAFHPADANC